MAETTQSDRREGMLRKVRALLAQADGTPFTEEADTFRQKADELMTMFAIEEFELENVGQAKREEIIQRWVGVTKVGNLIQAELISLSGALARFCRCRVVYYGSRGAKGTQVQARIIGFESDVAYFDVMFTSLHMHMTSDLEPKYNSGETLGQNVRRMKESGMKWERIAQLCNQGAGSTVIPFPGPKAITIYKAELRRVGAPQMKTMPSVFVRNFAAGFVTEIEQRLLEIRRQTEGNVERSGHSLVLFKDRDTQVDEEFKIIFADAKLGRLPQKAQAKFDGHARQAGAKSGATANLSKGVGGGSRGSLGS